MARADDKIAAKAMKQAGGRGAAAPAMRRLTPAAPAKIASKAGAPSPGNAHLNSRDARRS